MHDARSQAALYAIGVIGFLVALAWLITAPSYEPALIAIAAIGELLSLEYRRRERRKADPGAPMLAPGVQPGQVPPFYDLDEYVFQNLCRDLLEREPVVATCDVRGKRGQSQQGVDLLARRRQGDGIELGQCKCYRAFTASDIRSASNEFLEHADYWGGRGARRFILFVACELPDRKAQDEIDEQKTTFQERGLVYEVWSASTIRNKLRDHPAIVRNYLLSKFWVREICGTQLPINVETKRLARETEILENALLAQNDQLAERLSGATLDRLSRVQEDWRRGRHAEVSRWLDQVSDDLVTWTNLAAEAKARILRFKALVKLHLDDDVALARDCAEQASSLHSSASDKRVESLIAYHESGPQRALEIVEGETEVETVNLRAAYLIELEQAETALAELEPVAGKEDAETLRLRALAHLSLRDSDKALINISKARDLEPEWVSIRSARARILYFSVISPSFIRGPLSAFPAPVPWDFVRSDSLSIQRLNEAASLFSGLAGEEDSDSERSSAYRYRCWEFACLALDKSKQELAEELATQVQRQDPTNPCVIAWVVGRRLPLSLEGAERLLREKMKKEPTNIEVVNSLLALLAHEQRYAEAIALLDEKDMGELEDEFRVSWKARLYVDSGQVERAREIVRELDTREGVALRFSVLRAEAIRTSDWDQTTREVRAYYETTLDPIALWDLCEVWAQQGEFEEFAEWADTLVQQVGTFSALSFAVHGVFRASRWSQCIDLLEGSEHLCGKDGLPSDLRRVRAICLQRLGITDKATEQARALVRDDPSTENILVLARVLESKGDIPRLAILLREIEGREDLEPKDGLRCAWKIAHEDSRLASALLSEAVNRGLPDEGISAAYVLAQRLGLNELAGALVPKVDQLAREGRCGIEALSFNDAVARLRAIREQADALNESYRNGAAPIHLIATLAQTPLASLYCRSGEKALEYSGAGVAPLLAFHGGRSLPRFKEAPRWSVALDTTGLLLCADLGLLDQVEQSFGPLRLPAATVTSLIAAVDKLGPTQPEHEGAVVRIVELHRQGEIERVSPEGTVDPATQAIGESLGTEWVALYGEARTENGHVVAHLPLKDPAAGADLAPPADADARLTNCRTIVDVLKEQGLLSAERHENALDSMGAEGRSSRTAASPGGASSIYLLPSTAIVLARAGILEEACRYFKVRLHSDALDRLDAEAAERRRLARHCAFARAVLERIRRGIDSGDYVLLPEVDTEEVERLGQLNFDQHALWSLLNAGLSSDAVLWVDDRYTNSYGHSNGAPIVTTLEIVRALLSKSAIAPAKYHNVIHELRRRKVLFVPLDGKELIHELRRATIEDGRLVETTELRVLRRYVASCLAKPRVLQFPPLPDDAPNPHGEIGFVVSLQRAIADAVIASWASAPTLEHARAWSDWAIGSLYLDHGAVRRALTTTASREEHHHAEGVSLASLLTSAVALVEVGAGSPLLTAYMEWLEARMQDRFNSDERVRKATVEALRSSMEHILVDADHPRIAGAVFRDLFHAFPMELRVELGKDRSLMARIGTTAAQVLQIGPFSFDVNEYWESARAAVNGSPRKTPLWESSNEALIGPHDEEGHGASISISSAEHKKPFIVVTPELGLLASSSTSVVKALDERRPSLDCDEKAFSSLVARVLSLTSPTERVEEVTRLLDASYSVHIASVRDKLRSRRFRRVDFLPPDAGAMLRHFRINPSYGCGFENALRAGVTTLLEEEPLEFVLDRLIGLPIELPGQVIDGVRRLPASERDVVVRRIVRQPTSPTSTAHVAHILSVLGQERPAYLRLARKLVNRSLSNVGVDEARTLVAILAWTNDLLGQWEGARGWTAGARLAMTWYHSHVIFTSLKGAGAEPEWIRRHFESINDHLPWEMFRRDEAYWNDCAHPRRVNHLSLVLSGIGQVGTREPALLLPEHRALARALLFLEAEGKTLINFQLYHGSISAGDLLGSVFGGDREGRLTPFVEGSDSLEALREENVKASLEAAVENLERSEHTLNTWIFIRLVLSDLPVPEGLAGRLQAVVEGTDFCKLCGENPVHGVLALHGACGLARHFSGDSTVVHLRQEVLRVAERFSIFEGPEEEWETQGHKGGLPELFLMVVDCALTICRFSDSSESAVEDFVRLSCDLLRRWPAMGPTALNVANVVYSKLPPSLSVRLAGLLLEARAIA